MNWIQHPKCYHVGQTGTGKQRVWRDWSLVDESKGLPHLPQLLSTMLTSPAASLSLGIASESQGGCRSSRSTASPAGRKGRSLLPIAVREEDLSQKHPADFPLYLIGQMGYLPIPRPVSWMASIQPLDQHYALKHPM